MAAAKSSFSSAGAMAALCLVQRRKQSFFRGLGQFALVDLADEGLAVLLLLDLEDIGGALVAGQQIGAVIGLEEGLQRLDPRHQPHQIVLMAEREHRVDQVVADALFLQRDFQAVGEEIQNMISILSGTTFDDGRAAACFPDMDANESPRAARRSAKGSPNR